jgi:CO dehydrogenase nickel-insertion accessory protein CooC1
VIKGALRAEAPDLLTVILPQSLSRQPQESQELLSQVRLLLLLQPHCHSRGCICAEAAAVRAVML